MSKYIFFFGEGKYDKGLLGGKGANLSEMVRLGLPIPLGFTITTEACNAFQAKKQWPAGLKEAIAANVSKLEQRSGKKMLAAKNTLLLSVRSGAAVSMPGMMDTVLNLGLNDEMCEVVAKSTGNPRFALDSYRRFIQMFGDVVFEIPKAKFGRALDNLKERKGVKHDTELTTEDLRELIRIYKQIFQESAGRMFPSEPMEQLTLSVNAVFKSWNNPRARTYRNLNNIPHDLGTAVNVQAMVFGNMGESSGTGVAFTRNPSTGEAARFGEYLMNAQGEDVVAGLRTPLTLNDMKRQLPAIHAELIRIFDRLEEHFRDMQDIEFTIENRKLYILQTRNGKRTAPAAVRIAVDLVNEGLINKEEAVMRVSPEQIDQLLHKQLDPKAAKEATCLAKGLPASPGAAVGQVVFSSEGAVEAAKAGKKVILVRLETSPDDIEGMVSAQGVLTARGGMTSHAAVVARGMNLACIAGCSSLSVDEEAQTASIDLGGGKVLPLRAGDWLSLDATEGRVLKGKLPAVLPKLKGEFSTLLAMADSIRTLGVYANADTPNDAKVALDFGAGGIGLTRTEHMFFKKERLPVVREMILAPNKEGRARALAKLLPFQRQDFYGILKVMTGKPVVIRLMDPPLHEFLPHLGDAEEIASLARTSGVTPDAIERKINSLKEFNPMLGFRGCRLGVVYPEISAMQVRAIFEASLALLGEGFDPQPRIEIPLVGNIKEFRPLAKLCRKVARDTGAQGRVNYEVGTMIEVPRAALTSDELAKEAQFMSFGTNDLTQMTCGFSRDDSASFLKHYVEKKIYKRDPFQSIDGSGVAKLMNLCVALARSSRPNIDMGICGEHGGDPASIAICHRIGLNNVSCSPYRVPIARLAAAQAAVLFKGAKKAFPTNIRAKL